MKDSVENPNYYVTVRKYDSNGRNPIDYDVTPAVISIDFSHQEKELAVRATIDFFDADVNGSKLSQLMDSRATGYFFVMITAKDGTKSEQVFQGTVWDISSKETLDDSAFTVKLYDCLIYLQESEDSEFFAAGMKTEDIVHKIGNRWSLTFHYDYRSITHEKLVMRGKISDFLLTDVLDQVKKSTGKKYVVLAEKSYARIRTVGQNDTIYTISSKNNATEVRKYLTLNGAITKVIVLGTENDDAKTPVEATVYGNTRKYGTLQSILSKDEDTTLDKAKKEAQNIIADAEPSWEYDIKAPDIPWIKKGDLVKVKTTSLNGSYIVTSISREINNRGKTMTLTVVKK